MFNNSNNGLSAADVAAVMNGGNGFGYGFGEGWWVIIILFALMNGGFGFGRGFGGYGMGGNCGCNYGCQNAVATVADVERGFNNQGVTNKLNGLENGLCDGFYAVNTSILNGVNTIQGAIQQNTTAGMQNTYGLQSAIQNAAVANMQDTNALSRQLADCCCEQRQGQMQMINQMDRNACAITTAIQQQTQSIMQNDNANYRALHDELVAYRMQDKDDTIADLRSQVQALNLAASQQNQNAYLVNKLQPCPTPAYIVENPNCCPTPSGYCQGSCCNQ